MSDTILTVALLVAVFMLGRSMRRIYSSPSIEDNHTLPPEKALVIAVATFEGRPAIFHGGCVGCIWRHQNTTHAGIAFCRGCSYFAFNQSLPDKSIQEYRLEKL